MAENSFAKNDTLMLFDRCEIIESQTGGTTKENKLVTIEKWRVDDECLESSIYMFGVFGE